MQNTNDYKNPEVLRKMYWEEGLSLNQIGGRFCVDSTLILHHMKRLGIPRREPPKDKNRRDILNDLYTNQRLSSYEIGKRLNLGPRTVRKLLKRYGIKARSFSETSTKYPKTPFSEEPREKAYMLGLRTGDVHARWMKNTIRVQSTTTHPAFLGMMKNTFDKYSSVRTHKFFNKGFDSWQWFVYADLDTTFDFLLKKPEGMADWILKNDGSFFSFLAGYADSEGSWSILKSHENFTRFVFRISSMDEQILRQINAKLNELGIHSHLYLRAKAGTKNKNGVAYSKDFYALIVYRKSDVVSLAKILLMISRHEEKIGKIGIILDGTDKNWADIKNSVLEFRNQIKSTRLTKETKD